MLYVDSTTILPHLRANYGTSLAVTPLLGNKSQPQQVFYGLDHTIDFIYYIFTTVS